MFKLKRNLTAMAVALAIVVNMIPSIGVRADEGMFTPDQIDKLPLRQRGLKIKPSDLYNPNAPSISDAVVRLSSGCTAEFVSSKGLILTNHHCVFGALVAASGNGVDYGKDGYKADSMEREMHVPGFSVFITKRVEDVTDKIRLGSEGLKGSELAAKLKQCFFSFRFPSAMQQALFGGDRFVPISYQKDWAIVRDVAEKSGTPYNKAAYEAESKREAEAAAKRAAAAAPAKKP